MANKTLYVRDSDLALWELAQDQLGENISAQFAQFLRARVKAMSVFVQVLRSAPNSQDLAVMFNPVGPTGSGGPGSPSYIHEHQLVPFLEQKGVMASTASKIALALRGTQNVSELTVLRPAPQQPRQMTVLQRVSAFLDEKKPTPFCDECITTLLGLKRHQQAQQVCSAGVTSERFARARGICSNCNKSVIVTHA
jgi:hypothetical protein